MKKTERLSDRVAESILSMITVDRTLKPGDKLPNELELASQLGVSRITLREGIRMLAARNVLEIRRGRGTYVREDFKERSFRELHDVPTAEGSAESVYEMRMIFEPEVAYYATLRATESEMMHICELAKRIASGDPEDPRLLEDEKTFHRAIARATHHEFMNRLMPVLQEAFEQAMDLAPPSSRSPAPQPLRSSAHSRLHGQQKRRRREERHEDTHSAHHGRPEPDAGKNRRITRTAP